jgi:hypothetical protein
MNNEKNVDIDRRATQMHRYVPIFVLVSSKEVGYLCLLEICLVFVVTFNGFFLIDIIVLILKEILEAKHWRLSSAIRCVPTTKTNDVQQVRRIERAAHLLN